MLAHEFGHFYGGDTKLGPWIYKTRAAIGQRDRVDRNKPVGALVAAPDAIRIDTSLLTIQQVCERVNQAILVSRNNPGDIR